MIATLDKPLVLAKKCLVLMVWTKTEVGKCGHGLVD